MTGVRDELGRLHVDDTLLVRSQSDIFATGDVAHAVTDDEGNRTLTSCQHAIALGRSAGNNAAASLLGVQPIAYRQCRYVTCLDLGAWQAVLTEGWDRQVKLVREEAKTHKNQITSVWIYPPLADRRIALEAADLIIRIDA